MIEMNKRKIAFITSYPLKSEPVIKNRLSPYIGYMNSHNFEVSLFSSDSYDLSQEIDVKHTPVVGNRKSRGFIKRAYQEFVDAGRLLNTFKQSKIKTCVVTIPSMFLLFRLGIVKENTVYLDIRDLTWDYLSNTALTQRLFKFLARCIAKTKIRMVEGVAVTNNTEYQYVRNILKVDKSKISVVPNGVSRKQFTLLKEVKIAENNNIVVSYIGNIGIAQNLTVLIDAAEMLPNVSFMIVGDGNDRGRVESYCKSKGISNVTFTGRVTWDKTIAYYGETDILFAQLDEKFSGAMPSKLYEYLSTGKYVLYGGHGEAKEVLAKFENNTVIEPNNANEIVNAINIITRNSLNNSLSGKNKAIIKKCFIREDNVESFLQKVAVSGRREPEVN
ncbi:glycosyltransferase [Kangiella sediminilitoris]|uniref:Glycosyltransferase n=1 Tax=Kangiella sediminilitoris TaxID=1144748 RepID=A0A1B3BBG9_9GAMM|nr:glycosyltransferase [Kangiella sediminilitoris]AOE50145.1 Glycosyltransferase [Kangiella sediminilitoris]